MQQTTIAVDLAKSVFQVAISHRPGQVDEEHRPLAVGSRLGHYDVTALIGEGGMGQVYQATDTKLGREVALKLFNKEIDDV